MNDITDIDDARRKKLPMAKVNLEPVQRLCESFIKSLKDMGIDNIEAFVSHGGSLFKMVLVVETPIEGPAPTPPTPPGACI